MTDNANLSDKNYEKHDLQNTAGYKKYWTRTETDCNWTNNSLHWHHCDKETMENMSSTLPHIQEGKYKNEFEKNTKTSITNKDKQ